MVTLGPITPIVRVFDERKAREFYVDFLDFTVAWEHRFGDNFPLYMAVTRDGGTINRSEHQGDCPPAPRSGSRSRTWKACSGSLPARTICSPSRNARKCPGIRRNLSSPIRSAIASSSSSRPTGDSDRSIAATAVFPNPETRSLIPRRRRPPRISRSWPVKTGTRHAHAESRPVIRGRAGPVARPTGR